MQIETNELSITQTEAVGKQMLAYVLKTKNPDMGVTEINKKVSKVTGFGIDSGVIGLVLEDAVAGRPFHYRHKPPKKTVEVAAPVVQPPAPTPVVAVTKKNVEASKPLVLAPENVFFNPTTRPPLHPTADSWVDVNGNRIYGNDVVKVPNFQTEQRVITCKLSSRPDMYGEPILKLANGQWVSTKGVLLVSVN